MTLAERLRLCELEAKRKRARARANRRAAIRRGNRELAAWWDAAWYWANGAAGAYHRARELAAGRRS